MGLLMQRMWYNAPYRSRETCALTTGSVEEAMDLTIESEQEADGRWIAEVLELPGVLSYGPTRDTAIAHVQALALRVLADRLAKHTGLTPEDL